LLLVVVVLDSVLLLYYIQYRLDSIVSGRSDLDSVLLRPE
jgi:hypothetical protein